MIILKNRVNQYESKYSPIDSKASFFDLPRILRAMIRMTLLIFIKDSVQDSLKGSNDSRKA